MADTFIGRKLARSWTWSPGSDLDLSPAPGEATGLSVWALGVNRMPVSQDAQPPGLPEALTVPQLLLPLWFQVEVLASEGTAFGLKVCGLVEFVV